MIYGVIIDKGEKYYTYLKKLFHAMNNLQENYKWLLSNYECYPSDESIQNLLEDDFCILSGKEISALVEKEDFQWIWGSFLGFDPSVEDQEILKQSLSEDDMYEGFWKLPLTIHHPLAKIEIVAFDSSFTLVLTKDFSLLETLRETYPQAKDLAIMIEKDRNN